MSLGFGAGRPGLISRFTWGVAPAQAVFGGPLEPIQALKVIGKVGHADLDPGSSNADGIRHEAHAILLSC